MHRVNGITKPEVGALTVIFFIIFHYANMYPNIIILLDTEKRGQQEAAYHHRNVYVICIGPSSVVLRLSCFHRMQQHKCNERSWQSETTGHPSKVLTGNQSILTIKRPVLPTMTFSYYAAFFCTS